MDEEKGIIEISYLYIDNLLLPSNELIPKPEGGGLWFESYLSVKNSLE
jgi:hypothetical protein